MAVPIRFRRDSLIAAEEARDRAAGKAPCDPAWVSDEAARSTPPIQPGDCWKVVWGGVGGGADTLAGFHICCEKCGEIHGWTTARNCASKRDHPLGGRTCDHQEARTSCWAWILGPDGAPLEASPSLHSVVDLGGCGWHGHLRAGVMTE
jgi:hypothetical protein